MSIEYQNLAKRQRVSTPEPEIDMAPDEPSNQAASDDDSMSDGDYTDEQQQYLKLIPNLPSRYDAVEFLFGPKFTYAHAIETASWTASLTYQITQDEAIEEFRRFLWLKTYTKDGDAQIISPTPISMSAITLFCELC